MPKTAIIIPCFNEKKRLRVSAFLESVSQNSDLSFIFVNDGSTDGTKDLLKALCSTNSNQLLSITLPQNQGKASAIWRGFHKAFEKQFDYIGYWDADLATPLYEINNFCKLLDTSHLNLVMGSRVRLLNRKIERLVFRHYLGRIFATLASLILRISVYDTQCGAKLFRNTSELKAVFKSPFKTKWIFDVEILARFILIRKITKDEPLDTFAAEYPLEEWHDIEGSKIQFIDYLKAPWELFKIFMFIYSPGAEQRCNLLKSD